MVLKDKFKPSVFNSDPHIGIKLDFDTPKENVYEWFDAAIDKAGLKFCSTIQLKHLSHKAFGVKQYGYELTLLTKESLPVLRKELDALVNIIKDGDGYVDERCGMSIHVDCRYRNRVDVYNTFLEYQEMMFDLAAPHRKTNGSCIENTKGIGAFKHSAIYPSDKNKTVEVRIFESTLDIDKLCFFVNTVIGITNFNNAWSSDDDLNERE